MTKKQSTRTRRSATSRSGRIRRRATPSVRWHEAIIVDHARLRAWPHVERVELGLKERGGAMTARMAVKIYVREKREHPGPGEALPASAYVLVPIGRGLYRRRRVPTDVVWHAPAEFVTAPTDFLNPIDGGAMIGVPAHQFGTFGCVVVDATGNTFGVTAGHVVQTMQGKIVPNLQILQPPVQGPGVPPGASLIFARTASGFFGNTPAGFVDVAILRLTPSRSATTDPLDGMPVVRQILPSALVINNHVPATKIGAATGRTAAVFSAPVSSIVIDGIAVTNVLEFKGLPGQLFAARGDSGALVVSNEPGGPHAVIGILIAAAGPTPDAPAGRGFVMPFERMTGLRPF